MASQGIDITTPTLSISLHPIGGPSLPIVTLEHRCPKCDGTLDEINAHDAVIGWECPGCGYHDMIRDRSTA